MKICVPIEDPNGLDSKLYDHFGSAPCFLICDTEAEWFELVPNANAHHVHGTCDPLGVLNAKDFKAVVCRGMGPRAITRLAGAGIVVYRSNAATVKELIQESKAGKLADLTLKDACQQHSCH
jgi:predicted Fe-Mo cluster-binding NifX family protein